jgi:cellulose biosynthesis protein BcsQ
MYTYNKETLYIRRDSQGNITDVFESNPDRYYKVVDTVVRIDSGKPEHMILVKGGS